MIRQNPTLTELVAFEKESWPSQLRANHVQLVKRKVAFGEGIFLLNKHGQDVCQITVMPKKIPDITGFAQMRDLSVDKNSHDLWVVNMASSVHGKGYASELMAHVIKWAKGQGYETIQTGVTKIADPNPAVKALQNACQMANAKLEVVKEIKDYWPEDEASQGVGVVVKITL